MRVKVARWFDHLLGFMTHFWPVAVPVLLTGSSLLKRSLALGIPYDFNFLIPDLCYSCIPYDVSALMLSMDGQPIVRSRGCMPPWQGKIFCTLLVLHMTGAFLEGLISMDRIASLVVSISMTYVPITFFIFVQVIATPEAVVPVREAAGSSPGS